MNETDHRTLIATDVPFWNQSTGAEQRIAALVRFLKSKGVAVRVFYVVKLTSNDHEKITIQGLDVYEATSDKPPTDRLKLVQWYAKATLHQLKTAFQNSPTENSSKTLTLDNYRWPWAIDQFKDCVAEFKPNSVLIEYVKLAYLLDALDEKQRRDTLCMIDTHDVLHVRNSQFRQQGFVHWLDITEEQEADVLRKFDLILAIQEDEAKHFRKLAPEATTLVAGHSLESQGPQVVYKQNKKFVVGYVGSKNFSNLSAISRFLKLAWKNIDQDNYPMLELQIAGGICDWLSEDLSEFLETHPNVELLGRVSELNSFYSSVDVVINPVEFGTGLKIKNCEALFYGCQLITTPMGSNGIPDGMLGLHIALNHTEIVEKLFILVSNRERLTQSRDQVSENARTVFSNESAYSELLNAMIR